VAKIVSDNPDMKVDELKKKIEEDIKADYQHLEPRIYNPGL
jgi:translation elongation factor EF-1beta